MACDWIQVDKNLERKPETLAIASACSMDAGAVAWLVVRFWFWVDDHVGADGRIPFLDIDGLVAQVRGTDVPFWESMIKVGWLGRDTDGLFVPGYEARFSASAKQRASNTKRQRTLRNKKDGGGKSRSRNGAVAPASRSGRKKARPEERIVEEKIEDQSREEENTRASSVTSSGASPATKTPDATPVAQKSPETETPAKPAAERAGVANDPRKLIPPEHPFDWADVKTLANLVAKKCGLMGQSLSMSDRSLVLKACAISSRLGEHWIHDAVAALIAAYSRPSPPAGPRCAYLHGVLESKCTELGYDFNTLLARVNVPLEFLQPPAAASAATQTAGAT